MIRNFLKIISLKNFAKAHVKATMANSIGEIFKSKGELNNALYYYRKFLRLETNKKIKLLCIIRLQISTFIK